MNIQKEALFLCLLMHCVHVCLSQNDCTGVDCPALPNCIETVLEKGACCATCTQRGCTCEGYQYYDCIQAGFRKGKVPEGESYFVDFGSTECSCPRGGGKISCHFIPCLEIPPNCIEVVYPEDGCMRCGRIGCMHGSKKYEAGHSLQTDQCQVCHCPNEGGQLMCSAVPDCDPRKPVWETVIENNSPLRDISSRTQGQTSPMEPFSKQAEGNTLPLYKQEPPSFGKEDYDYTLAEPTSPAIQDLARPLESTTVPPAYRESNSTSSSSHDDKRHELGEKQLGLNSVRAGGDEVTRHVDSTAIEAQTKESTPLTTATHTVTTQNHWPQEETVERNSRHDTDGNALEETGHTAHDNKPDRHSGHHKRSDSHAANPGGSLSVGHYGQDKVPLEHRQMMTNKEQGTYPTVQFSPTNRAPVRVREDGEQPERQPQHTFYNYQPHNTEENTQVSAKELLKSCCETGEKWASANGHCNNMDPPSKDRHSICWTAQQQCCLGTLRESWCWAGIDAARAGSVCGADAGDKCGIDSYKECCGCCSLGLQFRGEGHHCEAHQYLDHHCRHVFLNCCRGEDGMAESRDGWHTLRDTPTQDHSPLPNRVSDSPYPKEAFSIGEERDGANTVEGPVPELEDTETVDEENRLKEDDRAAAAPPSLLPPRFQPTVPVNPCEGNSPCEQQCTPVGRRPQCSCSLGFSLRTDGHSCEDINECLSAQACQVDERCVNTVGSFICQRLITCPPGYNIINDICEDIDECAQSIHNCGFDSDCVNTEGSFRCNPKPRCPVGFHHNTQDNCIDIDECASLAQPCSPGFNCINTAGSYMCQRKIICSRGYHASPDGSRCVDVDECQSSLHRCGEGQLCHNLPGSYRCECQTGYQYDSFRRMCVDINECWHYPSRLCAQTCENIPGSYKCSCTSGFRLSSDGKTCEDVNECLANPCSQECANIYGSYQCYCRKGYFLKVDGHTCEDIDECSQSIGHLCTYKCLNVPGSYQCACPEYGYTMSPNGRSCRDIDECTTGSHNCSLAETCYNIQGGYRCLSLSCPPNYRKVSDTRCERISCPNYLECQNSPLRITYYYLSFQSNIIIPAQIFRIGPSPAYSGDNVIVSITQGNEENYFSTRKLNAYTGAVYLHRQAESPRDFLLNVEMKLWRQGTFTTFQARIYVFITANSL